MLNLNLEFFWLVSCENCQDLHLKSKSYLLRCFDMILSNSLIWKVCEGEKKAFRAPTLEKVKKVNCLVATC